MSQSRQSANVTTTTLLPAVQQCIFKFGFTRNATHAAKNRSPSPHSSANVPRRPRAPPTQQARQGSSGHTTTLPIARASKRSSSSHHHVSRLLVQENMAPLDAPKLGEGLDRGAERCGREEEDRGAHEAGQGGAASARAGGDAGVYHQQ